MNELPQGSEVQIPDMKEMKQITDFASNLFKIKKPEDMIDTANKAGLKKTLNAFDLIVLGVGAIIGSGIFTVVGIATVGSVNTPGAGPALIISMVLASLACVFSALCYSEFASMIPVAGSSYLYTYATMGEFPAWIIGWAVTLEYLVGYVAVVSAWSGYLFQFLKGFEHYLPSWLVNPPAQLIGNLPITEIAIGSSTMPIFLNIPSIIASIIICIILIKGIQESTKMTTVMVVVKLLVIALFVGVGFFYVNHINWIGEGADLISWWKTFAPNGLPGILSGAFLIFFAYIGFDAIATAAEETKEPQKNLPIGIIGSLAVCTIVYVLVGLVLTGMVPLDAIDVKAPIADAMSKIGNGQFTNYVSFLIAGGALAGLTSVLMVLMLASSRVLYAMSRDNFLPKSLQTVHKKFKTPYVITIAVAVIVIFGSLFLDINMAADLCVYGTFTSFIIVCVAVLILRKTDPKRPRPFKVPFCPWFPLLGILTCGGLMVNYTCSQISKSFETGAVLSSSPVLFLYWLFIGLMIYFSYSYKEKRKIEKNG